MAQPYVGEIRIFAGNFAPDGWMFCDGQLLPISENETLFQLIGTTYGGDGESTFALPDLRGRIPLHQGNGRILAETAGTEEVTLTVQQIPVHTHSLLASTAFAGDSNPFQRLTATSTGASIYGGAGTPPDIPPPAPVPLHAQALQPTGGSQPHDNLMPFLCVNFIISLFGIFPSQT